MSGADSLIRERMASAAAFDVVTDPRRVRESVARRQGRIKRRRRTTALLGVLAVAGLAVGVVRTVDQDSGGDVAVRASDAPSDADAPTESGPRFLPAPRWETSRGGSTAIAANVALGPDASGGNLPWDTIGRLEDGEVLLLALSIPEGESTAVDANFPPRELPLSLDDAQPGGLEGQPDHIAADRLLAQVNGWNIDLLVFYGGADPTSPVPTDPSAETRAAAQEQLARLVVPARETPSLSPAPAGACQPSNLRAGVHLDATDGTLVGRISIRNTSDATCMLEGRARVVEPRDVDARVLPSTPSEAAPAWRQEGAEPPDGWPTVRLAPRSEAQAVLRIRNWCVEPEGPVYFFIRLPYHTDRIAGAAPSVRIPPQCEDPQMPMELSLGPFEPQRTP